MFAPGHTLTPEQATALNEMWREYQRYGLRLSATGWPLTVTPLGRSGQVVGIDPKAFEPDPADFRPYPLAMPCLVYNSAGAVVGVYQAWVTADDGTTECRQASACPACPPPPPPVSPPPPASPPPPPPPTTGSLRARVVDGGSSPLDGRKVTLVGSGAQFTDSAGYCTWSPVTPGTAHQVVLVLDGGETADWAATWAGGGGSGSGDTATPLTVVAGGQTEVVFTVYS